MNDLAARGAKIIEAAPTEIAEEVLAKLQAIFQRIMMLS
jgi:hypothetical protein